MIPLRTALLGISALGGVVFGPPAWERLNRPEPEMIALMRQAHIHRGERIRLFEDLCVVG